MISYIVIMIFNTICIVIQTNLLSTSWLILVMMFVWFALTNILISINYYCLPHRVLSKLSLQDQIVLESSYSHIVTANKQFPFHEPTDMKIITKWIHGAGLHQQNSKKKMPDESHTEMHICKSCCSWCCRDCCDGMQHCLKLFFWRSVSTWFGAGQQLSNCALAKAR